MKTILIGGVAGGATTAARLRRLDEKAEIILIERGEHVSYANCGLPYYIGGKISERDSLFVQTKERFSQTLNIDVRVLHEAIGIYADTKQVEIRNIATGATYMESYDKLVLSTGAEPIKPPIPGIESNKIFTLRNVPDTDHIKNYIDTTKPKRAVVVGGGFIGLEMVENLHDAGLQVSLIERSNQVMAPLDYTMATVVHEHLRSKGVNLLLDENVIAFTQKDDTVTVCLASGKELEADMVILSIGVKPETRIAQVSGIALGAKGGVKVDEYMQTSIADIYALGDMVEVYNPVTNSTGLIPLAGPANKQGRIVANNIVAGNKYKYSGTIGTSIAKVFDMTVAAAGVASKHLTPEGIKHQVSITHGYSHAGYYPGALALTIQIAFDRVSGLLLGAQAVGYAGVDKRIDLLAQVIKNGGTIYDLQEIEHAYAPPYSSAKDPVNMSGFVAENCIKHMPVIHWNEVAKEIQAGSILLDVRTEIEFGLGHIAGAINIPHEALRERIAELDKNRRIIVNCAVGLRGYLASRILLQNGFAEVYNLSGGYKTYQLATQNQSSLMEYKPDMEKEKSNDTNAAKPILIDACGLQCPGPIMQLKANYDKIHQGERLEIKVTDPSFKADLEGWARMVGASIVRIEDAGGFTTACIQKGTKDSAAAPTGGDGKTIVVFSDSLDKAIAAFIIANGAAASGKKVSLFFTFWGLSILKKKEKPGVKKDFLGRMFGMMLPSSSKKLGLSQMNMGGMGGMMMRYIMKKKNIESLEGLMSQAINNGVELIACSMSMDVMGIKRQELIDEVNIGGVAAYLDRTDRANANLFI